ncbi:MAG TPA: flagellar motor protein MotB [Pirellulales bacterium]|jgi:chemotaxis protein MotB|nr:flagellar motor protein MotB [Pirellulales bacterium]
MAGKGGGAWKVAYADFVTAMMAFFLVMWIVAQNKPVKEAVAKYFRDPLGTVAAPTGPPLAIATDGGGLSNLKAPPKGPRGYGRGQLRADPKAALGSTLKGGAPLEGAQDPNGTRVGALITFAEDSAEFDERTKERLLGMVPALIGKPNMIEIRGHATGRPLPDSSPYGDAWQLSFARCLAAYKLLEQAGVEPYRMRLSQAGAHEPSQQPDNAEWVTHNSRVEVYMLGEFVRNVTKPRKQTSGSAKKAAPAKVAPAAEPAAK